MREPAFWHRPSSWISLSLAPFGALYGLVAGWRLQRGGLGKGPYKKQDKEDASHE